METANNPIRYVTFANDGALDGCYLQVPPEEHTNRMLVIDEALAPDWVKYRANESRDGVEPIPQAGTGRTEAEIIAAGMAVIQQHLNRTALSYGYDDIESMISYANEPAVERYQLEGLAARAWRSLCWYTAETIRDAVKAGDRMQPTDVELLAEMPAIDLPYPGPFLA